MKSSIIVALIATILPLSLFGNEPSAFGAGNINNPKPYGLTNNEKALLQNRKNLRKVVVKSNNQANEVESLRERLDGIQSVVESLSRKAQKNSMNLKKTNQANSEKLINSDEYEKRLSEVTQLNTLAIGQQKLIISEMNILLESINSSYIKKEEFNVLVNDFNKFKELVAKELAEKAKPKVVSFKTKKSSDIAKEAKQFFNKKYYSKSIDRYTYLIEKKYKPSYSHYMIGTMKYKRKNYSEAISYFKKSVSLYSKSKYMPTLMLYTANSMVKTGDKKNAKVFYAGIIKKYPSSKEAKEAQKSLNLIK